MRKGVNYININHSNYIHSRMTTAVETYLNSLHEDILTIDISNKDITSLPDLTRFKNLTKLDCSYNKLTLLPTLPQNLTKLYCFHNQLISLPTLPQNLTKLYCSYNKLTLLPTLPQKLKSLGYVNNPIYKIVNNDSLIKIKQNIQLLNNFRHLYYCLKFKKQLRKWLWENVREPNIKKQYNPIYLINNLDDEDNLDTVLNNWK